MFLLDAWSVLLGWLLHGGALILVMFDWHQRVIVAGVVFVDETLPIGMVWLWVPAAERRRNYLFFVALFHSYNIRMRVETYGNKELG